jgi:hypothetical protein
LEASQNEQRQSKELVFHYGKDWNFDEFSRYEALAIDVELPENVSEAPDIFVTVFDWDKVSADDVSWLIILLWHDSFLEDSIYRFPKWQSASQIHLLGTHSILRTKILKKEKF